jgi:hypothetical protein
MWKTIVLLNRGACDVRLGRVVHIGCQAAKRMRSLQICHWQMRLTVPFIDYALMFDEKLQQ